MATSQNGWPVVTDSQRSKLTDPTVYGADFPNGWLKGDVDTIFRYLITRLHHEVEPIVPGSCWGWFVKPIEGSATISNHSSGTAIDYNAERHPMGVRDTYSSGDRSRIRAILADLDGVVRWGGTYSTRPDDMHFEINAPASEVARVAARIREDDDVTKDEVKAAVREVLKEAATLELIGDAVLERKFPAPAGVEDADGVWWYGSFDREAYARLLELQKAVTDLTNLVTQTHPSGQ